MPSACTKTSTKSPYTFFTVDSDDDFDPYGSDVPSDIETKRELLLSHGLENQNIDIERGSCLSASSSTVSLPVCRICQLPGIEPSNPLISPCRCLGSIRYVHNICLLYCSTNCHFSPPSPPPPSPPPPPPLLPPPSISFSPGCRSLFLRAKFTFRYRARAGWARLANPPMYMIYYAKVV